MTIFVTSSRVEIRRYDGEELISRSEYGEVLNAFRKLTDAVNFVKGYDYYSDTGVNDLLQFAEMTDDFIVEEFWVDDIRNTIVAGTTVNFEGNNYTIQYDLAIEERELE